ncbi:hypothetical protein [Tuwongella immobilis]|uniref:Uncharacterized protein n=1 Tax=Tuwongella immobilis TaxID=692036 RepID=A0A6C2YN10_9BACT|nr:hypothetical protein [Tuwongella immobilis]VIP02671.1 unnamed protein product [Tuwongella immobilis]VTS02102.1 unnamed protein product [Tuwongella immobilis]
MKSLHRPWNRRWIWALVCVCGASAAGCGRNPDPQPVNIETLPSTAAAAATDPALSGEPAANPTSNAPGNSASANSQATSTPGEPFAFSQDAAGRALASALLPREIDALPFPALQPQRMIPPPLPIRDPTAGIPNGSGVIPRKSMAALPEIVPIRLPESMPDTTLRTIPRLPAMPSYSVPPAPTVVQRPWSASQFESPLSQHQPDRAAVGDTTLEFSAKSATTDNLPVRNVPTPFEPVDLPDPSRLAESAKWQTSMSQDIDRNLGALPAKPRPR